MNKYTFRDLVSACDETFGRLGFVTSLDVKNALRGRAFYALQADVSSDLQYLADVAGWEMVDNGTYRTYYKAGKPNADDTDYATNPVPGYGECGDPDCNCMSGEATSPLDLSVGAGLGMNPNYDPRTLQGLVQSTLYGPGVQGIGGAGIAGGVGRFFEGPQFITTPADPTGSTPPTEVESLQALRQDIKDHVNLLRDGVNTVEVLQDAQEFAANVAQVTARLTVNAHELIERIGLELDRLDGRG